MSIKTKNVLSVKEAIESRKSIRKYVQAPMSQEELQEVLSLVQLAPSAWNLQPWRFHVITDSALKEKLQEAAYGQQQVTSAPAVIVVTSDMEDVLAHLEETVHPGYAEDQKQGHIDNMNSIFGAMSVEERGQWGLTQTNIALGFLLVAAQGLGYSTVPMLGFDQAKVRELLGLPEHVLFAGLVPIGVGTEEGYPHHRLSLDKIVSYK